ncbi:hypothetical protein RCL1_004858 [Eukaryota sp. TZLM3-RCL]
MVALSTPILLILNADIDLLSDEADDNSFIVFSCTSQTTTTNELKKVQNLARILVAAPRLVIDASVSCQKLASSLSIVTSFCNFSIFQVPLSSLSLLLCLPSSFSSPPSTYEQLLETFLHTSNSLLGPLSKIFSRPSPKLDQLTQIASSFLSHIDPLHSLTSLSFPSHPSTNLTISKSLISLLQSWRLRSLPSSFVPLGACFYHKSNLFAHYCPIHFINSITSAAKMLKVFPTAVDNPLQSKLIDFYVSSDWVNVLSAHLHPPVEPISTDPYNHFFQSVELFLTDRQSTTTVVDSASYFPSPMVQCKLSFMSLNWGTVAVLFLTTSDAVKKSQQEIDPLMIEETRGFLFNLFQNHIFDELNRNEKVFFRSAKYADISAFIHYDIHSKFLKSHGNVSSLMTYFDCLVNRCDDVMMSFSGSDSSIIWAVRKDNHIVVIKSMSDNIDPNYFFEFFELS